MTRGLRPLDIRRPPPLRRRVLAGLQAPLQWTGAAHAYVRLAGVRGATILMYHSVPGDAAAPWIDPSNAMPPHVFEEQMRFLAHKRHVVSLTELADALESNETLPAGTVVLTFDDGYLDNLDVAAPVLTALGLPATLYLATGYVTRGENQWIDRAYSAFRARTCDRLVYTLDDERIDRDLSTSSAASTAYHELCASLLPATRLERERLLAEVAESLAPSRAPPRLTLTWDDVRTLVREHPRFEIGGHTAEHLDLRTHGGAAAKAEIDRCADDVERELGIRPAHFSFPYGRSTPETRRSAMATGLRTAVASADPALLVPGVDPFALPRVEAPAARARFQFVTSGAYPGLPQRLTGRA